MDRTKYPELQLELSPQDIACIADKVDEDLRLHADLSGRLETLLEKLLYALAWKNGDLQKVGHIIKGARDALPTSLNKGPGQVSDSLVGIWPSLRSRLSTSMSFVPSNFTNSMKKRKLPTRTR